MHAKRALLKDKAAVLVPKPKRINAAQMDRTEVWEWFDRQREGVKLEARNRLAIVQKVDALTVHCPKGVAVATLAREHGISEKTIWNYLAAISGKPRHDWLPYLAPRHSAAPIIAPVADASMGNTRLT